ncbi:MAG: T9SS type A sorting domain-containing protein, partial [Bacteroidales bacterium]|nr:T9SS type A sorting domain-containing protein [Bacteroidales bacterium]
SAHNNIMGSPGGSVYVPDEEVYYGNEWRIFNGRLTYKKGAAIIHQIRYLVNDDDLFFEAMQNYTVEYTDDIATGLDYKNSIADFTGVNLDSYFEQWYFGQGYPTYAVEYSYTTTGLFLAVTQTTSSNVTPFFDLPLEIKLNFGSGQDTVFRIPISGNISYLQTEIQDDFIQLQIDPNNWIINKTGNISVGTSEINNSLEFVVGPNPTKGDLQLSFGNPNTVKQISILDLSGRVVKRYSTNSSIRVDISDLSDGYYLVKAIDGNDIVSRKILKQ